MGKVKIMLYIKSETYQRYCKYTIIIENTTWKEKE